MKASSREKQRLAQGALWVQLRILLFALKKKKKKKNLEPGRAKFRQGSRVIKLLKKTTLSRYTCRKQITSNGNKCIKGEAISVIQEKDAAAWIQMLAVDKGGCV